MTNEMDNLTSEQAVEKSKYRIGIIIALKEEAKYLVKEIIDQDSDSEKWEIKTQDWEPATSDELDKNKVCEKGKPIGKVIPDNFSFTYEDDDKKLDCTVKTAKKMGQIDAAINTMLVMNLEIHACFLVGISGSLKDNVKLGDVVISQHCKYFGFDKASTISGDVVIANGFEEQKTLNDNIQIKGKNKKYKIIDREQMLGRESFLRIKRDVVSAPEFWLRNIPEIDLHNWKDKAVEIATWAGAIIATELYNNIIEYVPSGEQPLPLALRTNFKLFNLTYEKGKYNEFDDALGEYKIPNGSQLSEKFKQNLDGPRSVHFGTVLSTDYVIGCKNHKQFYNNRDKSNVTDAHIQSGESARSFWNQQPTLAVDMESYSFLKALRTYPATSDKSLKTALIIRGISDLCESKAETDKVSGGSIRKLAMKNATKTLMILLQKFDGRSE